MEIHPQRPRPVSGENSCGQPVLRIVGERQRLRLVAEPEDRKHGAEQLRIHNLQIGARAGDGYDRRLDPDGRCGDGGRMAG